MRYSARLDQEIFPCSCFSKDEYLQMFRWFKKPTVTSIYAFFMGISTRKVLSFSLAGNRKSRKMIHYFTHLPPPPPLQTFSPLLHICLNFFEHNRCFSITCWNGMSEKIVHMSTHDFSANINRISIESSGRRSNFILFNFALGCLPVLSKAYGRKSRTKVCRYLLVYIAGLL